MMFVLIRTGYSSISGITSLIKMFEGKKFNIIVLAHYYIEALFGKFVVPQNLGETFFSPPNLIKVLYTHAKSDHPAIPDGANFFEGGAKFWKCMLALVQFRK